MNTLTPDTADTLRDLYDLDGHTTVNLYDVVDLAQALAAEASQAPTPDGINTRVTHLLTQATTIHQLAARTIGDYTNRVPSGLYRALTDISNRFRTAATTIRDTAPEEPTLNAAHHAVYVILDRIGTDVLHVAHTQVASA